MGFNFINFSGVETTNQVAFGSKGAGPLRRSKLFINLPSASCRSWGGREGKRMTPGTKNGVISNIPNCDLQFSNKHFVNLVSRNKFHWKLKTFQLRISYLERSSAPESMRGRNLLEPKVPQHPTVKAAEERLTDQASWLRVSRLYLFFPNFLVVFGHRQLNIGKYR